MLAQQNGEPGGEVAREHEVLMLVAQAHSNTEIAKRLGIGDETVKTHVSRILARLGLRDHRTQAVMYAASHRLVAPLPAPPAGTERLGRRGGRGGR
ncbi:LuxR C-terminal-related transcriptional regulator [Streptomyces sp. PSAA01]|uniref:response regulator transcription factor n=1 Tax=Streptomyces sp. PSAA01 TaxID=2912762 RepID=UPI0027E37080|nr:LuxR C-terminal-related transcriptional regulator [Streptomyces sp. PSAA01]